MKSLPKYPATGFSMVELMVAMALGLIILAAVSLILVDSKKNYTTQDSLARLQENARFAMQFLTRDLRMAGYYGCADDITTVKSQLNMGGATAFSFNASNPIEGSESNSAWAPSGTALNVPSLAGDALAIRFLDSGTPITVTQDMNNQTAQMQIALNSGLAVGDVLMIGDCSSADVFQITNFNPAGGFDHIVHNTGGTQSPGNDPANNPHKLSKNYSTGANIMRFNSVVYYIGTGASDSPALFRQSLVNIGGNSTPTSQELVEGIERLEILYGVDTAGGDKIPDIYKKGSAIVAGDWGKIVSVRFGILARTLANTDSKSEEKKQFGTDRDTNSYDIDGDGSNDFTAPGDRYQRRIFRTTVVLRNLQ